MLLLLGSFIEYYFFRSTKMPMIRIYICHYLFSFHKLRVHTCSNCVLLTPISLFSGVGFIVSFLERFGMSGAHIFIVLLFKPNEKYLCRWTKHKIDFQNAKINFNMCQWCFVSFLMHLWLRYGPCHFFF